MVNKLCLHPASDGCNKCADECAVIALASKGYAPNGLKLASPSADREPLTIKHTAFAFIDSDHADNDAPMHWPSAIVSHPYPLQASEISWQTWQAGPSNKKGNAPLN